LLEPPYGLHLVSRQNEKELIEVSVLTSELGLHQRIRQHLCLALVSLQVRIVAFDHVTVEGFIGSP